MEDERPHGDYGAPCSNTLNRLLEGGMAFNFLVLENSQAMGTGKHAKRPAVFCEVIQMKPQCQHLLQRRSRGMCVNNSFLYGPRSPARCFDLLLQRQSCVLVPGNEPVCLRCLVEKRGAEGECRIPEYSLRHLQQSRILGHDFHRGMIEHVPDARLASRRLQISQ